MATTTNHRIRFMDNNFAQLISSQISFSSQLSAFPATNAINPFRSRAWRPSGYFEITASNKNIYINDGSDKTVAITEGDYTTPAALATEIQTQLNASSANWTVSYDLSGETFAFTIENTGSVTLRLSVTTNAIWDTIGFTTSVDLTSTEFIADQQRNHSYEHITFDLGYNASITFFALIGALNEVFSVSDNGTITLQASNLNLWDAPPFEVTIPKTSKSAMLFLDDYADTGYRFWRIRIDDKLNPLGPEGISIGYLYLGDYLTLQNRNISVGFEKRDVDPSEITESESGVLHFDTKTKYTRISGASIDLLNRSDKDALSLLYERFGNTTPLFVSLDPTNCISDTLDELTKYVFFSSEPSFRHIINDIFSMSLELRESI